MKHKKEYEKLNRIGVEKPRSYTETAVSVAVFQEGWLFALFQ